MYEIPEAIYNPNTQFNQIGIPFLATYFNDTSCSAGNDVDADGTTIKSSCCCSKFVWDHGRNVWNFTHGESTLPELVLYQGHGYYSTFCVSYVRQRYDDAVTFAFSSAFSISPDSTDNPAVVSDTKDSDNEDNKFLPNHFMEDDAMEWYKPPTSDTSPSKTPTQQDGSLFELGMSLSFYDSRGNSKVVVYEGVMPDGLTHTV